MSLQPFQCVAGGTIRASRFCKVSTVADFRVLEADANEQIIGISQTGSRLPPIELYLSGSTPDLASAGDPVGVHMDGEAALELGGTVVRGDRLKSDADGKGVAIATSGTTIQQFGAVALQSGSSGETIRVLVTPMRSERPALS